MSRASWMRLLRSTWGTIALKVIFKCSSKNCSFSVFFVRQTIHFMHIFVCCSKPLRQSRCTSTDKLFTQFQHRSVFCFAAHLMLLHRNVHNTSANNTNCNQCRVQQKPQLEQVNFEQFFKTIYFIRWFSHKKSVISDCMLPSIMNNSSYFWFHFSSMLSVLVT